MTDRRNAAGTPIDPTKNVLDLVQAAIQRQDDLRDAETRRLNELAAQKLMFDLELAKVLRANQDAASTLLATQLKEVKNDLSDRTAKLEQFRWESGGKSQGVSSTGAFLISMLSTVIAVGTLLVLVIRH
jgi:uncharacterized protein (DUF3084 family)